MATIEEALHSRLASSTDIKAIVPSTQSINPMRLNQRAELPAISFQRISGTRIHAMSEDDPSSEARFQFNCWARQFSDAHALKEAVRKRIQRFRGTVDGVRIDDILLDSERHLFEDDIETYQLQLDAIVHYQETT